MKWQLPIVVKQPNGPKTHLVYSAATAWLAVIASYAAWNHVLWATVMAILMMNLALLNAVMHAHARGYFNTMARLQEMAMRAMNATEPPGDRDRSTNTEAGGSAGPPRREVFGGDDGNTS